MSNGIALQSAPAPALIVAAGDRAAYRFLEFFTAQIRNPHTRRAYVRAVGEFCAWLEAHGLPSIAAVGSIQVAAYVEDLGHRRSAPTIKQHLAAIRMLFDWLATGGIRACRKLWRRPQDGLCPTPVSHFVNLWKTEAEREQPVLLAHGPRAGKAEALAQPQHGFKALDRAPGRVEGLQAAHPRHGPLDPDVVALDPLLQVLGHVMHRGPRQEPVFLGCGNGGWVGPRPIGADPVG